MPFDIGIGLMLGSLLHNLSDFSLLVSLTIGVLAALLPDLDFVLSYIKHRKTPTTEHRDGLHYPLLVIPAVGLLGLLVSPELGAVLAAGTLIHFLHDSVGIGFGVKWLYPFRRRSYLFLYQIKTPNNRAMPRQRLYSWTDAERSKMIQMYGYPDWIRYVYLRPNPWGIFEYTVFLASFVAVVASN